MTDWLYALPNFTSGNPLSDLSVYANTVSVGNSFWSIVVFLVMVVLYFGFTYNGSSNTKSLLGSMAMGTVMTSFLSLASLVSPDLTIFMWLITGLLALWVYNSED